MDIYRGWRFNYSSSEPELDKPLQIPEDICHRLNQLQDIFAAEWLFFRDDKNVSEQQIAYQKMDLPVAQANIKSKKLNKLDKKGRLWIFRSHDLDGDIVDYITRLWPLDYRSN
jgi:hypothetical protein